MLVGSSTSIGIIINLANILHGSIFLLLELVICTFWKLLPPRVNPHQISPFKKSLLNDACWHPVYIWHCCFQFGCESPHLYAFYESLICIKKKSSHTSNGMGMGYTSLVGLAPKMISNKLYSRVFNWIYAYSAWDKTLPHHLPKSYPVEPLPKISSLPHVCFVFIFAQTHLFSIMKVAAKA